MLELADKSFNKIPLTNGDTGVVNDTTKVSKTGDTMTGKLTAPQVEATNYFTTPTMVGEGNDTTYYHRVDFGHKGQDDVNFYEYSGKYNFYECRNGTKNSATLVGSIQPDGFHGNVKGNADSATKATNDSAGNNISTTYLKKTDNASSATKLSTARTIQTNLGSTTAGSFDGSANVEPGVKGTLPVANGGTGATDAAGARKNLGLGSLATKSSLSASDVGAVPITGGTMTGKLTGTAIEAKNGFTGNLTGNATSADKAKRMDRVLSLPYISWNDINTEYNITNANTDINVYFEYYIKRMRELYANDSSTASITFVGDMNPNISGPGIFRAYDWTDYNNTGMPRYCTGIFWGFNDDNTYRFGTFDGQFFCNKAGNQHI